MCPLASIHHSELEGVIGVWEWVQSRHMTPKHFGELELLHRDVRVNVAGKGDVFEMALQYFRLMSYYA